MVLYKSIFSFAGECDKDDPQSDLENGKAAMTLMTMFNVLFIGFLLYPKGGGVQGGTRAPALREEGDLGPNMWSGFL